MAILGGRGLIQDPNAQADSLDERSRRTDLAEQHVYSSTGTPYIVGANAIQISASYINYAFLPPVQAKFTPVKASIHINTTGPAGSKLYTAIYAFIPKTGKLQKLPGSSADFDAATAASITSVTMPGTATLYPGIQYFLAYYSSSTTPLYVGHDHILDWQLPIKALPLMNGFPPSINAKTDTYTRGVNFPHVVYLSKLGVELAY